MSKTLVQNFGKNVSFKPSVFVEPKNEVEVIECLRKHRAHAVRVMGSRHAWSEAIKTGGLLMSTRHLTQMELTPGFQSVRVGAGCKIKHLIRFLKKRGLTLPSVGLIDEQTIAGATATGTHGSGKHCLSHFIRSVRLVHYEVTTGEPVVSKIDNGAELSAAKCSLGLLGVIVEIEIEVRSAYRIEEHSKQHPSLASVLEQEKHYPLQQFFLMPWSWDFYCQHRYETSTSISRTAILYRLYWLLGIDWLLHFVIVLLTRFLCTQRFIKLFYQRILPKVIIENWTVTDDSHTVLTMDHDRFRHIEFELFVTRSNLESALNHARETIILFGEHSNAKQPPVSLHKQNRSLYCHHYPICVRRILRDDTLISMTSQADLNSEEDWYSLSFISYQSPHQRAGFLEFANSLTVSMEEKFNARCHWGKLNPLTPSTNQKLYPHIKKFREIANQYDPDARFANAWLKKSILADQPTAISRTGD